MILGFRNAEGKKSVDFFPSCTESVSLSDILTPKSKTPVGGKLTPLHARPEAGYAQLNLPSGVVQITS